jgi:endoglucanase
MYQPILFTHQGASWMPPEYATRGIVFPGPPAARVQPDPATLNVAWTRDWLARFNGEPASTNPCGPATVASELDIAKGFADRTGLPVYMGEFGVMDTADDRSRQSWLRLVRAEAEKRGFGWAYWDDGGAFAIYDRKSHAWKNALKAALLER